MPDIVLIHDLVEANGKTVKQNNLTIEHDIPLGTLVEIDFEGSQYHGVRLFIASYGRGCDGEPLYSLTHDRTYCDDQLETDCSGQEYVELYRRSYHHGSWGKDSLIIVTDGGLAKANADGYQEACNEIVDAARTSPHMVHPIFIPLIEGLPLTREANGYPGRRK